MKIKLPKQIRIGAHTYTIRLNPDIHTDDRELGCVRHYHQLIEISPFTADSEKDECLLHEINHIIDRNYNQHLTEDNIDCMAQGMTELLRNNLEIEFDWSDIEASEHK